MTIVSAITCAQSVGAHVSACQRFVWERLTFARRFGVGGAAAFDFLHRAGRPRGLVGFLEKSEQTAPARLGLAVASGCCGCTSAAVFAAFDVAQGEGVIGIPL